MPRSTRAPPSNASATCGSSLLIFIASIGCYIKSLWQEEFQRGPDLAAFHSRFSGRGQALPDAGYGARVQSRRIDPGEPFEATVLNERTMAAIVEAHSEACPATP